MTGRFKRDAAEVKRRRAGLLNRRHPCQLTNEKGTTGGGAKMCTDSPSSGGVVTRPRARGGGWKGGGEARGRLAELPRRTGGGKSGAYKGRFFIQSPKSLRRWVMAAKQATVP